MKPLAIVRLLRIRQWTKNLLVFAALIFAHEYGSATKVQLAVVAFFATCMFSSPVYALNDVLDAERDRAHPSKRKRPVASGEVSQALALGVSLAALLVGTLLGAFVGPSYLGGLFGYLALQLLYNFGLKRVPVVDVMVVSTGFVLRAALGAVAISAVISGWNWSASTRSP